MVWVLLVTMTLIAFGVVEKGVAGTGTTLVIIALAAAKTHLVLVRFMEIPLAPGNFRWLYQTWNFVVTAIIIIGFYVALGRAA